MSSEHVRWKHAGESLWKDDCERKKFLVPSLAIRFYIIRHEDTKSYELEVKAKFDDLLKNKAEQPTEGIAQQVRNGHHSKGHEEEVVCENRLASPHFHRLHANLVDNGITLEKKVNDLRMKYLQQEAMFHLKSRDC